MPPSLSFEEVIAGSMPTRDIGRDQERQEVNFASRKIRG
jgi:hypothetical protein